MHDVTEDVIVASEGRSDGPWSAHFGCYGISLTTGEFLWASHGRGLWGRFLRLLDFVPVFTNEFRDVPHHVTGREVVCASGRVLDVLTGRELRIVSKEEVQGYKKPRTDAQQLYDGRFQNVRTRVKVGENRWLSHKQDSRGTTAGGFQLFLLGDDDAGIWEFDLAKTGMHIDGNFYSYRYLAPNVYMVVSEERNVRPHPTKPNHVLPNPTRYHLLTLDLTDGRISSDILLDDRKLEDCRIEDGDEQSLLISFNSSGLNYFRRNFVT